jgi:hypothetical protein
MCLVKSYTPPSREAPLLMPLSPGYTHLLACSLAHCRPVVVVVVVVLLSRRLLHET